MEDEKTLYKFTGLCYPIHKDAPAIEITDSNGKKYAASFPNGPNYFVEAETLLRWMRSSIENIEMAIEMKSGNK